MSLAVSVSGDEDGSEALVWLPKACVHRGGSYSCSSGGLEAAAPNGVSGTRREASQPARGGGAGAEGEAEGAGGGGDTLPAAAAASAAVLPSLHRLCGGWGVEDSGLRLLCAVSSPFLQVGGPEGRRMSHGIRICRQNHLCTSCFCVCIYVCPFASLSLSISLCVCACVCACRPAGLPACLQAVCLLCKDP